MKTICHVLQDRINKEGPTIKHDGIGLNVYSFLRIGLGMVEFMLYCGMKLKNNLHHKITIFKIFMAGQ